MMTLSRAAAMLVSFVLSVLLRGAALVRDQLDQAAITPARASVELGGGQPLPTLALYAAHERLVPSPRQLRLRHLVIKLAVTFAVICHSARRVEIDRLERAHERPAQPKAVAHRLVDILGRGVAVGVEPECLGQEGSLQAIQNETLDFRTHDDG